MSWSFNSIALNIISYCLTANFLWLSRNNYSFWQSDSAFSSSSLFCLFFIAGVMYLHVNAVLH